VVRGGLGILRLVASDLDGTLLRSDGAVSRRTLEAFAAARAAGLEVVLASARPPHWLSEIAAEVGAGDIAICCNGAVVHDLREKRTLHHFALPARVGERVVRALRKAAPGVAFACEREHTAIREPAYEPLWPTPDLRPRTDALVFVQEPVSKLVVQHPTVGRDELQALAVAVCREEATVTISGERLVEISAVGVTKGFALHRVCEDLGVRAEEVVAFGDMPNDAEMLAWAGRGVAVANAHAEALAAADEVTASNDDDGVAVALERLLAANHL
jgi:Cof subfamily protein (haloacid dehalogenase superfamily)